MRPRAQRHRAGCSAPGAPARPPAAPAARAGSRRPPSVQRSAKGQPAGRSASSGTRPGMVASRVPRARPSRGRAANRPRVYGCASVRNTASVGPALDHRAAVHHQHALHGLGHHAQVVADQQQAHAVFGHQFGDQVEHLALDGHVQRGGRLVGDQQVGPAGQRDGDDHALALAARHLVRIGVEPLRAHRAAARARSRRSASARAAAALRPLCRRSGSAICRPMVCSGFSAVIGSWKIMPMRPPRSAAHRVFVERRQLLAVEADRAADAWRHRAAGPSAPAR